MVYTLEELRSVITPIAVRYQLKAVYVFGSYARGEAREDSDVDLLVDTDGTQLTSLFSLGALYCAFEEALGKPVDLLTISSLEGPCRRKSDVYFRAQVAKERREVYAAA